MANTEASCRLGFVGIGNMGNPMARNLASYAEKRGLDRAHCEIMSTLEELAESCDIVHTCLANDEVALSLYRQFFAAPPRKVIFVDHSTLYPTTSTTLQTEAEQNGMHYLACPVFGPPAAAKTAGLLVVVSGDSSSREVVKPILVPAIGKKIIDCGDDASKGALLKILGNNCILGTIELLSESFTLAEKTGFDVELYYEFIQQWFPAAAWVNYGKKIRDGSFSGKTGFTLPGGMKDASFIRRLGAETSTPTPIIDQAWNHLTTAKAIGGEGLDWSACSAGMRVTAGLPPFKGEDFSLPSTKEKTNGEANGEGPENTNGLSGGITDGKTA